MLTLCNSVMFSTYAHVNGAGATQSRGQSDMSTRTSTTQDGRRLLGMRTLSAGSWRTYGPEAMPLQAVIVGSDWQEDTGYGSTVASSALAAWEAFTTRRLLVLGQQYCAAECGECVTRQGETCDACQTRGAVRDALHDSVLIRDGMAYALSRHGWLAHLTPERAEQYRAALVPVVQLCAPGQSWAPSDDLSWEGVAQLPARVGTLLARALSWGHAQALATGTPEPDAEAVWDTLSGTRANYGATSAEGVRRAMRQAWEGVLSVSADQAEEESYCTEYESALLTLASQLRTPGLAEPEPRHQSYTVTVPVTVTAYATMTVSARSAEDAVELASETGVGWDDVELSRWDSELSADYDSADAEAA